MPANTGGVAVNGYKVYINSLDQGDWFLAYDGTGQPTVLTTEIDNLQRGELYRFYVTAVNYVGEGTQSPQAVLLCAATPTAPGQPTIISSSPTSISFRWTAPADNGGVPIQTYQIFSKLTG